MSATVSCYTNVVNTGKISVQINVEVWTSNISIIDKPTKMAGG
jgi:acyl-CoA hydrolase